MKKLYQEFFCIPQGGKIREKVFLARIAISVIIMLTCMVVMSLSAYAFFTSSITSATNTIQAANYSLTIKDSSGQVVSDTYDCPLVTSDLHTFTLEASGTASTGYCKIEITNESGTKVYYTTQIFTSEENDRPTSIQLEIQAAKGSIIKFTSQWGTSAYYADNQVELYGTENTKRIDHSLTAYSNYTVTEGDTFESIAEKYGVSADDIRIYNGIDSLETGVELKIPGITENATVDSPTSSIQQKQPIIEYIVVKGDKLGEIAKKFGTTVERLAAYNNIADAYHIEVGEIIRIPPADWEIPTDPSDSTEDEE